MDHPPTPNNESRLSRGFFKKPTEQVARSLLGKFLLRKLESGQWIGGKIVETEAYLSQNDPASHSYRGKTRRNAAMFAPPGVIYVYSIHAKHCMNFSTERAETGAAVLIRALEPIWGIDHMRAKRNQTDLRKLTSGPAMLCQALGIDLEHNGKDAHSASWLAILPGDRVPKTSVVTTPRIGISQGQDLPLRFLIAGSPYASRKHTGKT
jgi:DNA-3-methyladenine glycosylase